MSQDTNHILEDSYSDILTAPSNNPEHEYHGISPVIVDNLDDSISFEVSALTKAVSTPTVQVQKRLDFDGKTLYTFEASNNGTPFQTELNAGDNIEINRSTNVISVANKKKLIVDSPLNKYMDEDGIHIGIDGTGYDYYAGDNLQVSNRTFICNGNKFDYGLSNTTTGISNYVIGNANNVENTSASFDTNIVLGTYNNVDGNGLNFCLGNRNNLNTTTQYAKNYVVGRNNTITNSTTGKGAYAFGCDFTVNDDELAIGFNGAAHSKYSDKIYNYGNIVDYGNYTGIGEIYNFGQNNIISNNRPNSYILGKYNTINDDNTSANKGTTFALGLYNTTSGNGYAFNIGHYNNTTNVDSQTRAYTFGYNCSATDNGTETTRMCSMAIGYGINSNENTVNVGFPYYGISIADGGVYIRRQGSSHKVGKVYYTNNATIDSNTNICEINFTDSSHIEYGTIRIECREVTTPTRALIQAYNSSNAQIASMLVHLESGTYIQSVLPFCDGTISKIVITNDSTATPSAPGAIVGDIYAFIDGIEL